MPRRLPNALADRARIGEVFNNLISNAIKYNDKPQRWIDVFLTDHGTHFHDEITRAMLENSSAHFEIVIDERDLWLEVRAYPSEEGVSVYATDIRERKRAEERMISINEAQLRFVSDASHELRAPLTSISGNLDLLIRYPNMSAEDLATALQDASNETWRMSRLVNDLLTLARGENGQPRRELLALNEVLESAWRVAFTLSDQRCFELGVIEPSMVLGDADAIKQLAVILLENAVKYTTDGGTIRLESEVDRPVGRIFGHRQWHGHPDGRSTPRL